MEEYVDFEPMDVDTSFSSINKDISVIENDEPDCKSFMKTEKIDAYTQMNSCDIMSNNTELQSKQVWNVKKYHLNIPRPANNKRRTEIKSLIKVLFIGIVILGISIVTHQIINFKCMQEKNITNIENTLFRNIFGQSVAVKDIIRALSDDTNSKILFLYGGTGVGKTYAVSLILENYWKYSNVYHYTMPSFADFSPDFMVGLTFCDNSILVVDDLTADDIFVKAQIQELIAKSEHLRKKLTVILVFNCDNVNGDFVKKCDESFFFKLKENFAKIKAMKEYIEFVPLSEEHLKKCIRKELGGTMMSESKLELLLKNFNVTLDGCKGVYNKIKLMTVF